jgi:hypothetical protein
MADETVCQKAEIFNNAGDDRLSNSSLYHQPCSHYFIGVQPVYLLQVLDEIIQKYPFQPVDDYAGPAAYSAHNSGI